MIQKIFNSVNFKASAIACSHEFVQFQNQIRNIGRVLSDLEIIEAGGWRQKDAEAIAADTIGYSHSECVAYRKSQLEGQLKAECRKAVKRLNALNKIFFTQTGEYILPFEANRDKLLYDELIEFVKAV